MSNIRTYAQLGARIRLDALREEERAILRLFPDLAPTHAPKAAIATTGTQKAQRVRIHWASTAKGRARLTRAMRLSWKKRRNV